MATIGIVESSPVAGAASSLGVQDFLKVLLTQLTFQDPLKPVDNQQFMAQMAQFTSLEQTQQLNARMDALLSTQASLQSVGLLGRTVEFLGETGRTTGNVTALALDGNSPLLTVQTTAGTTLTGIPLSRVTAVR